jgi:aspartyl-tRNA(Asn)/glutamyl-tRNA(Gln) amidotransferase subunit C
MKYNKIMGIHCAYNRAGNGKLVGGAMAKIEKETLEHLEVLAKLSLTKEERERTLTELEKMLCYAEKIQEVDTSEVSLAVEGSQDNRFREDEISGKESGFLATGNSPKTRDNQYVVPKTV